MKISLIGYMGSGKSVVGKILSEKLELPYLDLDKYIASQEQRTISSIFEEKGEIYFRKNESRYLKELLSKKSYVLSTGGGTPIFYNHMDLINMHSQSFYLYASPTTLSKRLLHEKNNRPLIAHIKDEDLPEFIAKHLFERNPYYQRAINMVDTNGKSIEEVAQEIVSIQSQT